MYKMCACVCVSLYVCVSMCLRGHKWNTRVHGLFTDKISRQTVIPASNYTMFADTFA